MSAALLEAIPHENIEAARLHFEYYGHVNLGGLIDPALLEPAIVDASRLSSPQNTHNRTRETVTKLREPDREREKALQAVLYAMQQGAVLLGSGIMPVLPGEKFQLELSEMERGTMGLARQYRDTLAGVIGITNLQGESYQWVEGQEGKQSVDYLIKPGDIVIHGVHRRSIHRDYTSYDSGVRFGLVAATVADRDSEITQ